MDPSLPTDSSAAMARVLSDGQATYILPDVFKFLDSDSICSAWAVCQLWRKHAEKDLPYRLHLEEVDRTEFCQIVNPTLTYDFRSYPDDGDMVGPNLVVRSYKLDLDRVQQGPEETAMAAVHYTALLIEDATPLIALKVSTTSNWRILRYLHLWRTFSASDWNRFGRFLLSQLQSMYTLNLVLLLKSKGSEEDGFGALMDVVQEAGNEPNETLANIMITCPLVFNNQDNELPQKPSLLLDFVPLLCPNIEECHVRFVCQTGNQDQPEILGTVEAELSIREWGNHMELYFKSPNADSTERVPELLRTWAASDRLNTELHPLATLYECETLYVTMIDDLDLVSTVLPITGAHFEELFLRIRINNQKAHYVVAKAMKKWSFDPRFVQLTELRINFHEYERPDSEWSSSERTSWLSAWRELIGNSFRETEDGESDAAMGMTNIEHVSVHYDTDPHQGMYVYCSVIFWRFVLLFLPEFTTLSTNAKIKLLRCLDRVRRPEKTNVIRIVDTDEEIHVCWDPDFDLEVIDYMLVVSLFDQLPFWRQP